MLGERSRWRRVPPPPRPRRNYRQLSGKMRRAGCSTICDAPQVRFGMNRPPLNTAQNEMNPNDLIISGNHIDLTAALKEYVGNKVEKLFRHENRIIRLRVELDGENRVHNERRYTSRGLISINGPEIVATGSDPDLYKAIDEMVRKLDRLLSDRTGMRQEKRDHPHPIDLPSDLPKV